MAIELLTSHCYQPVPFSMAFQPIVDVERERIYAYEALVRGPKGEPAASILSNVPREDLYSLDHCCRKRAMELACRLELPEKGIKLATNFMPGAIYADGTSVEDTLDIAERLQFPQNLLIFEINEREEVTNPQRLQEIADGHRRNGFEFAIDDFGAGFANLSLLADLSASSLKIDMSLVRCMDRRPRARKIVSAILDLCSTLNIRVIAEGVETAEEFDALSECGVRFMQGYLLGRPEFEKLPTFQMPSRRLRGLPQARPDCGVPLVKTRSAVAA